MSNSHKRSRIKKYEKRRKNNKAISILLIVAIILTIVLIFTVFFGGNDKSIDKHEKETTGQITFTDDKDEDTTDETIDIEDEIDQEDNDLNEVENEENNENNNEVTEIDSSDPNVIEAYTGNWRPLGTDQQGPHTTVYAEDSADRIEIKQAVLSVTGLNEDDLVEHWVGNGGDQKVISTVSNNEKTEIYRVYLSWIDEEGWQPTKVEKLKKVSKEN